MSAPNDSDTGVADDGDAHYRDARYYDHAYGRYKSDVAFYLRSAEASGGPVLELGVGTGRVAMALADRGIDVVGLDRMPTMLARARERLAKKPRRIRERVELVEGDLRRARLGRRFPLVVAPFNVLQHLYTRDDVERALATCAAHLEADGRLAFDVMLPDPATLARDPARFYKCRPIRHPADGRRYAYEEAFQYEHDGQIQTTTMRFTALDDPSDQRLDTLTQRQFFPRELDALLHYNGFEILEHDGGFEGEDVDEHAESQVVVARRRQRTRSTPARG
ncbi:MAG TPA: class I SAM-dependent methyltransferase [Sandaracinaceae bacterium LLY-WYZ-13_1]|nr:class I SAM-dependent methyltransferase [Sandaracinaceae bacterium LLY-WYZ-13_1]